MPNTRAQRLFFAWRATALHQRVVGIKNAAIQGDFASHDMVTTKAKRLRPSAVEGRSAIEREKLANLSVDGDGLAGPIHRIVVSHRRERGKLPGCRSAVLVNPYLLGVGACGRRIRVELRE